MKIKQLIKEIDFTEVKGSKEVEIQGITTDSRTVCPGDLFIAKKGRRHNGTEFIGDAVLSGAVAIITDLYNPFYQNVVQLIHPEPRNVEGLVAKRFYQDPSRDLFLVGITGTSGKTTTTHLIQHLLEELGPCGLIGTIETNTGLHRLEGKLTTPEGATLSKLLREMVQYGCKNSVLEVSSIGVSEQRINGLTFDVAVFTNLTGEHLDYHHTMESYAITKRAFLASCSGEGQYVVLNKDSAWSVFMQEAIVGKVLTYSLKDPQADIYAHRIELFQDHSVCLIDIAEETYSLEVPLIGQHNISNALAAIGVALIRGLSIERILHRIALVPQIPGRLEVIARFPVQVIVDYAHKPDALEQALSTLQAVTTGKIITVFGCGGERDVYKRPEMARVVAKFSAFSIITSDNPRQEPPMKIIEDILSGFVDARQYIVEVDRARAIEKALQYASPGDVVFIAGKGHETYQILGTAMLEFDDREIARTLLEKTF